MTLLFMLNAFCHMRGDALSLAETATSSEDNNRKESASLQDKRLTKASSSFQSLPPSITSLLLFRGLPLHILDLLAPHTVAASLYTASKMVHCH